MTRPADTSSLRVLFMTSPFAPLSRAAGHRLTRLVSRLGQHGIVPAVVTVKEGCFDQVDPNSLKVLPKGMPLIRVGCMSIERHYSRIHARIRDWPKMPAKAVSLAVRVGTRLARALCVPDPMVFWAMAALPRVLGLIRRFGPHVLVASLPQYSPPVLAALVAGLTKLPLVVDYRDPWASNVKAAGAPGWQVWVHRRLERWVLSKASAATATTAEQVEEICRSTGARPELFRVVPNALDLGPDAGAEAVPADRFTLVHAGSLYGDRSLEPLLRAMRLLKDDGTIAPGQFELRLYGSARPADMRQAQCEQVEAFVNPIGPVPRSELLRHVRGCHVSVAIQADCHSHSLPSKVLESIAVGKPVLCLTSHGSTLERLIRACGMGWSFEPSEYELMAGQLRRLIRGEDRLPTEPVPGTMDLYTVEATVRAFAEVLQRAAGRPAGARDVDGPHAPQAGPGSPSGQDPLAPSQVSQGSGATGSNNL